VTVVEALADKVPAWCSRHVYLDLRVIDRENNIRITAGGSVIHPPHDLDVLLRHSPLSIPRPERRC
jgi:hypothetical protein